MENINFFDGIMEKEIEKNQPLASRMRPRSLSDFIGQDHIVGEGKILNRVIKADRIPSMIFFGPPGTGKTSLAYIIAKTTKMDYLEISATNSGVKDIKEVVEKATNNLSLYGKKTLLFIDEIHRFNKGQQDTLLPHVESGLIILIGATTENPYFEVNKALLSRCKLVPLHKLKEKDLILLINKTINDEELGFGRYNVKISDDALNYLARISTGDARVLLNNLELAVLSTDPVNGEIFIDMEVIENSSFEKNISYGKNEDEHYNNISAFIKSMRGSDPDAALYYLAKMLLGGEDLKFICRRIMIFAAEDIGLADPNAINIASSTFNSVNVVGNPEARIILSNAVIYMALAPKSNTAYKAIDDAMDFVKHNGHYDIPNYLNDGHYAGAKIINSGKKYLYPHDYDNAWVKQRYLPYELGDLKFYKSKNVGLESKLNERVKYIKNGGSNGDKETF